MIPMKKALSYVANQCIAGLLVIAPVYLAIVLLLKGLKTLLDLMKPIAKVFPESMRASNLAALVIFLFLCVLVGIAMHTAVGENIRNSLERSFFSRIPGYSLFQSLTLRLAGQSQDDAWESALVEIEHALVPAFIIEDLPDGRFTVFVPSIPTPMAGTVYILPPERVHRTDVPFKQAVLTVSKWGSGCKNLVAAMKQVESRSPHPLPSTTVDMATIEQMAKTNPSHPGAA